jgi:RNA recognition motif-containing protein
LLKHRWHCTSLRKNAVFTLFERFFSKIMSVSVPIVFCLSVRIINTNFGFLHFVDIQSAIQVMQHAEQYQIGNQPLSISNKVLKNANAAMNNSG